MTRSPRARQLTPLELQRLEWLRRLGRLLDSAVAVPGTPWRVGLDPVLGLIPGIGDLVALGFGLAIIWQARALGVPRIVRLRMIFNAGIDAVLGSVPFVGDLFDIAWQSNTMNLALLERHLFEERSTGSDWLFVVALILFVLAAITIPVLLLTWIVRLLPGVW